MELSIREAKARFSEAVVSVARGERVVVTKHGEPFVKLVPASRKRGLDLEKLARLRKELGMVGISAALPPNFDDPGFSRQVLGIEDNT